MPGEPGVTGPGVLGVVEIPSLAGGLAVELPPGEIVGTGAGGLAGGAAVAGGLNIR